MLGFLPISGAPVGASGDFAIAAGGGGSSATPTDRWFLARLVGSRSSRSGFPGRGLYRAETCGQQSPSSARLLTQARLVRMPSASVGFMNRPVYKAIGVSSSSPSASATSTQKVLARLIGSRSSYSNSSFPGRALYAARFSCDKLVLPSRSSLPGPGSEVFQNCCPDDVLGQNIYGTWSVVSGTCSRMDGRVDVFAGAGGAWGTGPPIFIDPDNNIFFNLLISCTGGPVPTWSVLMGGTGFPPPIGVITCDPFSFVVTIGPIVDGACVGAVLRLTITA